MSWTQPQCADCWNKDNPTRKAVTLVNGCKETCCKCGKQTTDGIFIRADPSTVPYPKKD